MHELQASTHAAARAAETTPTNPPAEASTNALDMAKIEETRREMEVLKKDLQQLRQESAAANGMLRKNCIQVDCIPIHPYLRRTGQIYGS